MLSQHGSGRIVGHEARGFLTCARTKAVKRVWSTNTTEDIYHLHRGQHARANDRLNQTNPPSQVALLQRRSQAKRYDIFLSLCSPCFQWWDGMSVSNWSFALFFFFPSLVGTAKTRCALLSHVCAVEEKRVCGDDDGL